ncbi:MAG: TRAP transporter small permease [Nitratireductor sp.]|nr:TRAP transporter small permease [Nitratireductor sp.]MCC0020074.1 TRAP transporter small permease [Nitratireductor sp.]
MAYVGGLTLIALTIITCVSIIGRGLATLSYSDFMETSLPAVSDMMKAMKFGPIPGDFEIVEAGIAFAIFSFLPWCQITRGHATVDIITSMFSLRANRVLDVITEILMSFVLVLIAWRLWIGMLDKHRYGETSFILQFPVWWSFLISAIAAVIAAAISLWMIWVRLRELKTGHPVYGGEQGAIH